MQKKHSLLSKSSSKGSSHRDHMAKARNSMVQSAHDAEAPARRSMVQSIDETVEDDATQQMKSADDYDGYNEAPTLCTDFVPSGRMSVHDFVHGHAEHERLDDFLDGHSSDDTSHDGDITMEHVQQNVLHQSMDDDNDID